MNINTYLYPKIKNHIDSLDGEVLLAWVIKKNRTWVLTHPEYKLSRVEEKRFTDAIEKRKKHEPVAYIIGSKEFYSLRFQVTRDTLIPRPETELLVDQAIHYIKNRSAQSSPMVKGKEKKEMCVIDIGTGCGNIIISTAINTCQASSLKRETIQSSRLPAPPKRSELLGKTSEKVCYIATDISNPALTIARKNHQQLCPNIPIQFIQSDLLTDLPHHILNRNHILILANLPYLPISAKKNISQDIVKHEPQNALFSGIDGLDHYKKLIQHIKETKKPDQTITLIAESADDQTPKIELTAKHSRSITHNHGITIISF